jgi:mono/diheme cytochrome c family protein
MRLDVRKKFLLALLAAVGAIGCRSLPYSSGPKQVPVDQAAPPVSRLDAPDEAHTSQWEAGRAIYVGNCAGCHKPKPIQDFAIDEWKEKIIPGMSAKAKLAPEQTQSLVEYVMAVKRFQLVGSGHAKVRPVAAAPISAADNR